ncbi:MAG: response regulator transcription factor [Acidimicrobiales bacterium]|nr:response regulator transcription factor [Acidimicrobiales bacterium]
MRVALAEDHALVRDGLVRLVESETDMELAGVASDLPGLLALVEKEDPDVVVTDIRMPPNRADEGIQAAAWMRVNRPQTAVVVLSQYATPALALALLGDGSAGRGYLLKERVAGAAELASAIRTVADGGSVIDPTVVDDLVRSRAGKRDSDLSWLTPRESEILAGMAQGRSNSGIAEHLSLSERAVEKHINSLFAKLGLREERDVNRRVKAVLLYLNEQPPG